MIPSGSHAGSRPSIPRNSALRWDFFTVFHRDAGENNQTQGDHQLTTIEFVMGKLGPKPAADLGCLLRHPIFFRFALLSIGARIERGCSTARAGATQPDQGQQPNATIKCSDKTHHTHHCTDKSAFMGPPAPILTLAPKPGKGTGLPGGDCPEKHRLAKRTQSCLIVEIFHKDFFQLKEKYYREMNEEDLFFVC